MRKWIVGGVAGLLSLTILGALAAGLLFWHFTRDLPDSTALANYQPAVMTRVHAGDGRLLAEYAIEHRIFVPVSEMPPLLKQAFISAEDQHFYSHNGVDYQGTLRALLGNLEKIGTGARPKGASTITQQVARNFFLTNEVSVSRKLKEAMLAFRIEKALSKDRILELYLNEIYLGAGSYGVAAAAMSYFDKSLDQLTLGETAFLAALPKAPEHYKPNQNNDKARERRDYVIERMLEDGAITPVQAAAAKAEPLVVHHRDEDETVHADYFAEEVRKELASRYGDTELYRGGLSVRTSLDPHLQAIAERVFHEGLVMYDRRHGWHNGAIQQGPSSTALERLAQTPVPPAMPKWTLAAVVKIDDSGADIVLKDGTKGHIPMTELTWARATETDQKLGPPVKRPSDVLALGDLILVEPVTTGGDDGKLKYPEGTYGLRQIPNASGGMMALDPHTGRVLAMVGGWSFEQSQFNRAIQANRQPGSSFKPFVYMAALDNGFTPSTIVLDAPFVIDQGGNLGKWKPANYGEKFFGPTPLRVGVEQSRNLMTVRVASTIGMDKVADYAARFGIADHLPQVLSMALGATDTTLERMVTGYAMIVNGGKKITPSLIDSVQDRTGKTILRHDERPCTGCDTLAADGKPPEIPDEREQIIDPATAYQMVSILQGVVERGTGSAVRAVGKPLAGKTGTTNDFTDAWFVGFSPDLVAGLYVGFDQPKTLGSRETGGRISAPVFRDFMIEALEHKPATPFRVPPGVRLVRIDLETGLPASPGNAKAILEAYKPGTEPSRDGPEQAGGPASTTAMPHPTDNPTSSGQTDNGLY
jgi:penicillin-binding protein 1A